MPVYQCSFQRGLLTEEMKTKMAAAITDAHVDATGAPRIFVHTFFNELPPGIAFSADGPDPTISGITGSIRARRTLEQSRS
jgi:phenylpyruvate tautomerase PptA (4-oxalocrotonate tautomerase family)